MLAVFIGGGHNLETAHINDNVPEVSLHQQRVCLYDRVGIISRISPTILLYLQRDVLQDFIIHLGLEGVAFSSLNMEQIIEKLLCYGELDPHQTRFIKEVAEIDGLIVSEEVFMRAAVYLKMGNYAIYKSILPDKIGDSILIKNMKVKIDEATLQ
jgi:hypothetical protein